MISQPRIIGNHVFFFRDGGIITVPAADGSAAGASTPTNKPDATDPLYVELAKIEKLVGKHQKDEKIVWTPSPAILVPVDVLINKRQITLDFDSGDLSALSFELLFGFTPTNIGVGGTGQYNQNTENAVKGWLHVEQYGQDSNVTPVNVVDQYSYLSLSGDLTFDDNIVKTGFSAMLLTSPKNTGKLIMP